jgi:hypothetical protein
MCRYKSEDIIYISNKFFIMKRKGQGGGLLHLPDRVIQNGKSMGNDKSGLQRHFVSVCEYGEVNA